MTSLPANHPRIPESLKLLGRFGYIIRGALYIAIAVSAAATAAGYIRPRNMRVFQREMALWPIGYLLLGIFAVGFLGYGFDLMLRVLLPSDKPRPRWQEFLRRFGLACAAIGQVALAIGCLAGISHMHKFPGGPQQWAREVLTYRMGDWAMIGVGLGVIGFAIGQCVLAIVIRFRRQTDLGSLSHRGKKRLEWLARIGYVARGMVFGTLGYFLARAGWRRDPRSAHDVSGTLYEIGKGEYGPWLLVCVAAGLAAYGALMIVLSRYRRLDGAQGP